jgi:hypothetical protein
MRIRPNFPRSRKTIDVGGGGGPKYPHSGLRARFSGLGGSPPFLKSRCRSVPRWCSPECPSFPGGVETAADLVLSPKLGPWAGRPERRRLLFSPHSETVRRRPRALVLARSVGLRYNRLGRRAPFFAAHPSHCCKVDLVRVHRRTRCSAEALGLARDLQ